MCPCHAIWHRVCVCEGSGKIARIARVCTTTKPLYIDLRFIKILLKQDYTHNIMNINENIFNDGVSRLFKQLINKNFSTTDIRRG